MLRTVTETPTMIALLHDGYDMMPIDMAHSWGLATFDELTQYAETGATFVDGRGRLATVVKTFTPETFAEAESRLHTIDNLLQEDV